jgi:3-deoxy-D-manno-octulosonic-acid transferase
MLVAMERLSYPILPRLIYAGLWCLLLPALLLFISFRSLRQAGYRRHLGERFGSYPMSCKAPIWLHAASLGEVKAAAPLLQALRAEHPAVPLLITCQTPAGRQAAAALAFEDCHAVYLPFDMGWTVRRFLRHFKPRIALVFETEIWPVLFLETRRSGIALMIVNARMTERSLTRYRRFGGVLRAAVAMPDAIACQSREDATRYREAGADAAVVSVTGNIKWDLVSDPERVAEAERQRHAWRQRPVWLTASSHEHEEAAVLAMHRALLARHPQALLLWAPRHPERFEAVVTAVDMQGLALARRSTQPWPDDRTRVFVIDTLGELPAFMPCADAVFVGGSLQAVGGHNVMEPAVYGLPILVGPHTGHFADSVAALKAGGGLIQCPDADTLQAELLALLDDASRRMHMAKANADTVAGNGGALEKTKALVARRLA